MWSAVGPTTMNCVTHDRWVLQHIDANQWRGLCSSEKFHQIIRKQRLWRINGSLHENNYLVRIKVLSAWGMHTDETTYLIKFFVDISFILFIQLQCLLSEFIAQSFNSRKDLCRGRERSDIAT